MNLGLSICTCATSQIGLLFLIWLLMTGLWMPLSNTGIVDARVDALEAYSTMGDGILATLIPRQVGTPSLLFGRISQLPGTSSLVCG